MGSVTLEDGRRFGYDEAGDPAGEPVLFVPGSGASSRNRPPAEEAARRGLRMVCVDKPGYRESTPKPGYSLKDVTDDINVKRGVGRLCVIPAQFEVRLSVGIDARLGRSWAVPAAPKRAGIMPSGGHTWPRRSGEAREPTGGTGTSAPTVRSR